jgi:lipoprotein-anchoring transpeptidase ErfK/SrfK
MTLTFLRAVRVLSAAILVSAGLSIGLTPPVTAQAPSYPAGRSLTLQVLLDRAGFSPGEIDGGVGQNTQRAIEAFQAAHDLQPTSQMNAGTWKALGGVAADDVLVRYTITSNDLEGPFVEHIPDDMMEKSQLPALAYTSLLEALAEKFHAKPALLRSLNPRATWTMGDEILVPNVLNGSVAPASTSDGTTAKDEKNPAAIPPKTNEPKEPAPAASPEPGGPVTVIVSKEKSTLTVLNAEGNVIFHAPVTSGSEHDSLPIGEWKVTRTLKNPTFYYNPALFWDGDPAHAKAKIAPGPNNPVGVVWIDISKENYGLHGTPEPNRIGYAQSHGCVRLTNWDAQRVAALVHPGTRVIFQ